MQNQSKTRKEQLYEELDSLRVKALQENETHIAKCIYEAMLKLAAEG